MEGLKGKGLDQSKTPDKELMLLFLRGDKEAFRILYERYFKRVFSMAYRFSRNYETSKDITQEVFLRLYQKRELYSPKISFNTFFYRLTYNCILNYLRDHRDRLTKDDLSPILFSSTTTPEHITGSNELLKKMNERLYQLPENQKTAFILNKIEGLSYNEIADVMNININTVKSLIHRATMSIMELKDE